MARHWKRCAKRPRPCKSAGLVLAGKVLVMVEAFSHRPLWQHYTEDALANDKRGAGEILAALPPGELSVFDLGFFSFLWFDAFTETAKYFVTRLREKTAYRTVQVLSVPLLPGRNHPAGPVPRQPVPASAAPGVGVVARDVVSVFDELSPPTGCRPPGLRAVSPPLADRRRLCPDQTTVGFGVRVDGRGMGCSCRSLRPCFSMPSC